MAHQNNQAFVEACQSTAPTAAEGVQQLLNQGADPDTVDTRGRTGLIQAAYWGRTQVVKTLLEAGADPNKKKEGGARWTPLWNAAAAGHAEIVQILLDRGADKTLAPESGERKGISPAQIALIKKHPMVVRLLDEDLANKEGERLMAAFAQATLVHCLSTRYRRAQGFEVFPADHPEHAGKNTCDPSFTAEQVKAVLEGIGRKDTGTSNPIANEPTGTMVFNPNCDNAFLLSGDSESANDQWLLNWRQIGLENTRRKGGAVIQVVTPPGLSKMQIAEASMAADQGVRVVKIDCKNLLGVRDRLHDGRNSGLNYVQLMKMPTVQQLLRSGKGEIPPTRQELEEENARLKELEAENVVLKEQLAKFEGVPREPEPEP